MSTTDLSLCSSSEVSVSAQLLLVPLDLRLRAPEIEAGGDLLGGLLDGVRDLLEVHLADDVEGEFLRHGGDSISEEPLGPGRILRDPLEDRRPGYARAVSSRPVRVPFGPVDAIVGGRPRLLGLPAVEAELGDVAGGVLVASRASTLPESRDLQLQPGELGVRGPRLQQRRCAGRVLRDRVALRELVGLAPGTRSAAARARRASACGR